MSTTTPYTSVYGPMVGRGAVEQFALASINLWVVPYIAEYERQNFLPPRSTSVPPTPESIHGDMDLNRFSAALFPEIIVVVQPQGIVERHESGEYGSWYDMIVAACVQVEGDQDATRALADIYGTALQTLVAEQGMLGVLADGVTLVPTRTRLETAYRLNFPDSEVRDVIMAQMDFRVFVADLLSDFGGPFSPPANPYATPLPVSTADRVEVGIVRTTPDGAAGTYTTDFVEIDATVNPPVTEFEEEQVNWPGPGFGS